MKRLSLGLLIGLTILVGLASQTIHGIWTYALLHSRLDQAAPDIARDTEAASEQRLAGRLGHLAETVAAGLEQDIRALERQLGTVAAGLDSTRPLADAARVQLGLLESSHPAWLSTAWLRLDGGGALFTVPSNDTVRLPWMRRDDPVTDLEAALQSGFELEADDHDDTPVLTLVAGALGDEGRSALACRFKAARLLERQRRHLEPELGAGLYLTDTQGFRLSSYGRLPGQDRPLFPGWSPSFEPGTRSSWVQNDLGDRLFLTETYLPALDWVVLLTVDEDHAAAQLQGPATSMRRRLGALKRDLLRSSAWMILLTGLLSLPIYLLLARLAILPLRRFQSALDDLADRRALAQAPDDGCRETADLWATAERLAAAMETERSRVDKVEKNAQAERAARDSELEALRRRTQELEGSLSEAKGEHQQRLETLSRELEIPSSSVAELVDGRELDPAVLDPLGRVLIQLRGMQERLRAPSSLGSTGPLQTRSLDVVELCRRAVDRCSAAADAKGVKIRTLFYSRSMKILADRDTLEPILHQLLANAVARTASNREVGIEAAFDWKESTVDVTIWDEGTSLNEEGARRIFEPMGKDGQGPPHAFRQQGLNLALLKHMIERLGGDVEAAPRASGHGTQFVLSFAQGGDPSATDLPSGARLPQPKRHLLVVEDNELTRRLLIDLLTTKGYRAVQAADGTEALRLAAAEPPDLILMDIQLPGMGGLETIRAFRRTPECRHIPILALSAHSRSSDIEDCIAAGADGFVRKPIGIDSLVRAVESQFLA